MKDTNYRDKKEDNKKQISNELHERSIAQLKNQRLRFMVSKDGTSVSFFKNDDQTLMVEYFFGEFDSHAKRLYYQIMGNPINYG